MSSLELNLRLASLYHYLISGVCSTNPQLQWEIWFCYAGLSDYEQRIKMTAAECTQFYRHTTNTTVNFQVHPKAGILRERTMQASRIFLK